MVCSIMSSIKILMMNNNDIINHINIILHIKKKNLDIVKKFQALCKALGRNLVIISHAKTTVITDGKSQLGPELPRGLSYALTATADVIGYATASKEDGKFYISFQAYDERTVGSRLKPLAQKVLEFDYSSVMNEIIKYKEE